jgi:hypothetical protein
MQKFKNSNSSDSGVSNQQTRAMSNRPKARSRDNIEQPFFTDDNNLSVNEKGIIKSRSLPPLQKLVMV